MNKLTESTLVPISLVVVLLSAAFSISSLYSQVTVSAKEIEVLKAEQKEYNRLVNGIKEDLSEIKGYLKKRIR